MTQYCPIAHFAQKTPEKLALLSAHQTLSFRELDQKINTTEPPLFYVTKDPLQSILYLFSALRKKKTIALFSPKNPCSTTHQLIENTMKWVSLGVAPGTILATSGSSGKIKLIQHSFDSHLCSAESVNQRFALQSDDYFYLSLPLYHVSGIAVCFRAFSVGATLLLNAHEHLATYLSAVPTQVILWKKKKLFFPNIRIRLLGGGPIFIALEKTDYVSYGMTEVASSIAIGKEELQVLPHVQVKIDDKKRIWIKGQSLCSGSFSEDEGVTTHNCTQWFATQDLGSWCSKQSNTLKFLGRLDEQFISGGENISPKEIQEALNKHPNIVKSSVTLLQDKLYGTRPVAEILVKKPMREETIKTYLLASLPKFKIPDHILIKELRNVGDNGKNFSWP